MTESNQMTPSGHVHDCTGLDMACPCGFVFRVARIYVSIEVFDNDTKVALASEHFNCETSSTAIAALERAVARLRQST